MALWRIGKELEDGCCALFDNHLKGLRKVQNICVIMPGSEINILVCKFRALSLHMVKFLISFQGGLV